MQTLFGLSFSLVLLRVCVLALLAAGHSLTSAQQKTLSPSDHPRLFCDLAAELGYPSRGYKVSTGGCGSNMIDVTATPGRNGLNNNIAFYSMGKVGQPTRLQRISLILNVNNTREKAAAQAELARVAMALASKIVVKPPEGLDAVIRRAGSKRWEVGPWSVEVKTEVWPTGLGQDTVVYFRPK